MNPWRTLLEGHVVGRAPGAPPAAPAWHAGAASGESLAARRSRHRRQWVALALGILASGGLVALQLGALRSGMRAEQEGRLRQQAALLDQQLTRQISAVGAGLGTVLDDLPVWAAQRDWAAVSLRLRALDSAVIATRTIVLLDEEGRVIASSRPELLGVDASARSFFQAARSTAAPSRLLVSPPYRTQLGIWAFNVSRTVTTPDGRFAGVVSATLDPDWLAVTLGTTSYAPDMWVALAHADGRLVQIAPAPPKPVDGLDLAQPGTMFMRHRASGATESLFTGPIAATGQASRIIVQRTLLIDLPPEDRLVLALSRDLDAVIATWRQQAWAGAAFVALLAGLGAFGLSRVQRGERLAAAAADAARQALQTQERRWALALESMDLGVWDADLRQGVEYRSAGFRRLLGLPGEPGPDAALGWQDRVHPEDAAAVRQRLQEHLAGRSPAFEARCRLRAGDGAWRWVRIGGLVFDRAADGTALRIVGTLLDETDRARAEALRLERDRAEAASQAKSEFMSRMSHDMRTPLNAVIGFAQLLQMRAGESDADERRRQIELIEQGGRHLLALVEDVLDLSRIERGQLDLSLQPVPLAPLLGQAVALVQPLARHAGLTLGLQPPPGEASVQADVLRLTQVLNNLLGNAIKYNRPGGSVTVRWRRDDLAAELPAIAPRPGWRIEVEDTGLGLDAEQQAHLFEPFNRLGRAHSAISGTGLGLVLSRWFVEHMGGRLMVHSAPGVGSTFAVWLPAA